MILYSFTSSIALTTCFSQSWVSDVTSHARPGVKNIDKLGYDLLGANMDETRSFNCETNCVKKPPHMLTILLNHKCWLPNMFLHLSQ